VTGGGIEETSYAQAASEGIPDRSEEIASLVRVAVESDVVRRAVASGRLWREVPVAVPMGEGVLEGFIDLLFEEEGSLIVVDYKTDALEATETGDAVDRYRLQAGSYALAVQNATGKAVQEVVFLFLQPRRGETLTNINELVEEAEDAAVAHLG
jgi:ATP-dependent helicase/nuclease subunit A